MNRARLAFAFVLFSAAFLSSCGQSESDKEAKRLAQMRVDSLQLANAKLIRLEQSRKDSITCIEQTKVIGDIRFAMSKNAVEPKKKAFLTSIQKKAEYGFTEYYIGNFQLAHNPLRDYYFNDSLYQFDIHGDGIDWEYFDIKLPEQIDAITQVIKLQYGDPQLSYPLPPRYTMENHYTYLIHSWTVGKKDIEVRVSDEGTRYRVLVTIKQPEVEQRLQLLEEERKKRKTQDAKRVF